MGKERLPKGVRRLPSGKYQARYVGPDLIRHTAPVTFDLSQSAAQWISDEQRLMELNTWTPPREREAARRSEAEAAKHNTFSAYCEVFFEEHSLKPNTEQEYRRVIRTRLDPYFKDRPLTSITRADLRAWRASQPKGTPSANAGAYRILHSILKSAEDDELISDAPSLPRKMSASRAKPKRDAILATLDQLDAITEAMPAHLRMAVVLAYTTGLRQGELLELRRKDIDAKTHTVKVSRAISKTRNPSAAGACKDCGRVIGTPKTNKGKRQVHIPASVIPDLSAHLLAHAGKGANGLIFPGATHDHTDVSTLQWHFKKACKVAGVPDLRWHELRHASMSLLGELNVGPNQLMHRAGHSSRKAMEVYQHSDLDQDRRATELLDEHLVKHREGRA